MSAQNIVIVSKDTTDVSTGTSPVNRLLSVTEVDTNFINLKQGIIDLESYSNTTFAPLDGPTFINTSGNATYQNAIPTSDDSFQIANTQFVQNVTAPITSTINDNIIGNSALKAEINTKAKLSGGNNFTGTQLLTGAVNTTLALNTDSIVTSGYVDYAFQNTNVSIIPKLDVTSDLGMAARAWRNLYVDTILPATSNSTLGTPTQRFKDLYLAGQTVFIGGASLSQGVAGGLVLPTGSSFGDEDSVVPVNLISTTLDKIYGSQTTQTRKLTVSLTASGSIAERDPLVLNSNGTVSTITTTNDTFIGFADASVNNGSDVEVVLSGELSGFTGLTAGSEVFLEADGNLRFNRALPSDQKIGVAVSSSSLFIYSTSTLDIYALAKKKVSLTDFSVTTAAAGTNDLSYNSSTGEFTFTPVNLSTYATETYVDTEIANLVNSAPTSLDTLDELAAALNDDANFASTVTNSLATKAPLSNPALTGIPTAPTASSGTNTTQLATTEFVQTAIANDIELTDLSISTASASSGGALSYNNTTGVFTFTPADTSNFGNASLSSFSITTGTANSNGGLAYNNTTGVFTFTPADLSGYLTSYTETDPVVGAINGVVKADGNGNISAAVAGTDYSTFDGAFSSLTGTPTTISGYGITDAFDGAFSSLTGTPTTIAGYGITDAFDGAFSSLTGTPTTIAGYGITDPIAYTNADIDIGSNDFITTGKILFSNVYSVVGDLPSASTYHGMFAHVHGTGKAYFAHAGNWVELANNSQIFDGAWSSLTGTPTTIAGYGITDAATISYVDTEIANLINSAPGALDTLDELAAALGDDANFSTTVTNNLALKAPLADPALTGTPTAPTATSGTNTTQIATTAFVQAAISGLGGGGGASVTVAGTAPSSPSAGDLWFDNTDLVLYVYYNDGTSNQWVQTNPSGAGGSSGGSSGGASVTVGNTAPTSPTAGDLWFDDDDLFLYVYIDDGSSTQWVKTNPSGSGSSSTWAEKTAAYTAEAGDKLIVDTSTAVTVTLPATAALGDEIRIIDGTGNAATNNITVARNGHNIEGSATDLTIDVDRAAFGLVYYNATQGWVMMER